MLLAMHVPDHVLDGRVALVAAVASAWSLAWCGRRIWQGSQASRLVLVPAVAAMVFAGQMVNYPLPGLATSGHLIGGVLAAAVLGPYAAAWTIALVLVLQCLVFGDGGITALGANVLNMALVAVFAGWAVGQRLQGSHPGVLRRVAGVMVAAWVSVMAASVVCALQLTWSGRVSVGTALATLCWYHAWIGVGEALVTGAVVATCALVAPVWLAGSHASGGGQPIPTPKHAAIGLVCGLLIATLLAPWASGYDDGLDRALATWNIAADATVWNLAIFPDYALAPAVAARLPAVHSMLASALVGIVGTLAAFACGQAAARWLGAGVHPLHD